MDLEDMISWLEGWWPRWSEDVGWTNSRAEDKRESEGGIIYMNEFKDNFTAGKRATFG